MKILIVEDDYDTAQALKDVLEDLGQVTVCSINLDTFVMPPREEVVKLIADVDVILLDNDLSTSYTGKDLLSDCRGRHVIGTSTHSTLGSTNFRFKEAIGEPEHREELRTLVMNSGSPTRSK